MRKVYIVDHPFPPTAEDIADAEAAGAAEVLCGIPEGLARQGVESFGYHEVEEPPPPLPDEIPMWRIRAILAADGLEDAIDAAVAALPDTEDNRLIKALWRPGGAPNFVRSSPRVQAMVDALGPEIGLTWAQVDDIRARAVALPA